MKDSEENKLIKKMALIYEKTWNDVVENLPKWKKNIIINDFEVIDGYHVYKNKFSTRIANEAAHEARVRADEIIDIKYSGKY